MADLVLLGLAQLRHRAHVVGAGVVGDEGRVVAEAALAAGLLDQLPLAARLEDVLGAVALDQRQRADVGGAPLLARRGDLAQQLVEVLPVGRALARRSGPNGSPAGRRAPRPRSRSRRRAQPRRSPRGRRAPSRGRSRRSSPSSGGSRRPRAAPPARPRAAVRASRAACACCRWRRSSSGARSCTCRSREIPISASPSSSSSEARESGLRSAVGCTSTRPPSPVITTLASTSARESSP